MKTCALLAGLMAMVAGRMFAALPVETTVTAPTRLELLNGGKPAGSIGLRVGEKLAVIDVTDGYVSVRYRNLSGRVRAAHTDLPPPEVPAEGVAPQVETVAAPVAPPVVALPPAPPEPPPPVWTASSTFERAFADKLVAVEQGALRRFGPARLAGVKFYGIYFSASWCGPCREFTPSLVDAYGKIRSLYPEFEVVLVNSDRSANEMAAYMRDDRMPWPALDWDKIRSAREITRLAGSGIPCLVLVDGNGKVLSDSYRSGRYVGPHAVVDDTWKILRDYRRTHPRPKA